MAIFQYKKIASVNRLFEGIYVFIVIVLLVSSTKARRLAEDPVELVIYPAKAGELEKKYQLIVKPENQIDADAVPLYAKAAKLIPKDFNQEQIREWLKLPVKQLPQQQAKVQRM